ncbi:hypothetical protein BGX30_009350 [Mortierella sp. GBA39]|nr:hypothetical protein BGX30_009350 [Mortierella sp. GBA39]
MSTTARRNPVWDLVEEAMENYNHIDRPASPQYASANSSVRRNPVWGLVEEAIENYTHIDRPFEAPPGARGPQAWPYIEPPSTSEDSLPSNAHSMGPQEYPTTSDSTPKDYSTPGRDLTKAIISASQGDKDAQVALGDMYKEGLGVNQDYQSAMEWYLKAGEQGDAVGQRKVGMMYSLCLGAANQGNAAARYNIGVLYEQGQGVPLDYSQAMVWFRKAADQGLSQAQCHIGVLYELGQGVPQDVFKAKDRYPRLPNKEICELNSTLVFCTNKDEVCPRTSTKQWIV